MFILSKNKNLRFDIFKSNPESWKIIDLIISFFNEEELKQLEVNIKGKTISFKEQLLSYYENMQPATSLSCAEIRIACIIKNLKIDEIDKSNFRLNREIIDLFSDLFSN